jgi:protein-disulfide isomerase
MQTGQCEICFYADWNYSLFDKLLLAWQNEQPHFEHKEKKMTKQINKRPKHRTDNRSRMITVGVIVIGALLIAFALISPNVKSGTGVVLPEQVKRPAGDGLTLGDVTAPARIEVFEDFQCPSCIRYSNEIEPLILEKLVATGKAYYIFQNYAFIDTNSAAKESQGAANASLCANEQGKFWEYHDVLFANWNGENQGAFTANHLVEFADALKLNVEDFQACVDENRYAAEVKASFENGVAMGVNGTPSVFVNGVIIAPGYIPSFEEIAAAVEAAQP